MRTRRLLVLAALLAAATACKKAPPKQAGPAPEAAAAAAPVDEAPKKPAEAEWVYSSAGKRDPFRSPLSGEDGPKLAGSPNKCTTALGRFELTQLKLVAVITGLEDPVAMVEAPNGVGYSVRREACIGKNGGTVVAIRSDGVMVAERIVKADGSRDTVQTLIPLPKQAALNLEE